MKNKGREKRTWLIGMAALLLFSVHYSLFIRGIAPPGKQRSRVYLVHADELRYDRWQNNDAQVLVGKVEFLHDGARLLCDSANFFEETNSFEAFGHVRMLQGDTLSLNSDYGYYDGNAKIMEALDNVVLRHRGSLLYTDSLYYDRIENRGYFEQGGRLVDKTTTLTSFWGEYHTDTKMAFFWDTVKMTDKKFTLTTDSLYYNTQTSVAQIVGPSDIVSGSSHIYSELGFYNTKTEQSTLLGRSVMKDGERTLVGDSVWYDSKEGLSKAFGNVVYQDPVNKNQLTSNYGEYNEQTGYAMVTDSAMAVDFSQKDSLFMHADTFKIYTFNIETDSVYRVIHAFNKVRAYREDVQAVCDSLTYNTRDSVMTMYRDPIVWNNGQQLVGEQIDVFMRDSVVDRAHVINQAFSIEQLRGGEYFNQVSSKDMYAFFTDGNIREAEAVDNVLVIYHPEDDADTTFIGMVYAETSDLKMYLADGKMDKIWMPKAEGTMYPLSQIPPDKRLLPKFAWFDYVRPLSKEDIFNWRGKKPGTEMKPEKRREAPAQVVQQVLTGRRQERGNGDE